MTKIIVACVAPNHPSGTRHRAGLTITNKMACYEVSSEQEKAILSDPHIRVMDSKKDVCAKMIETYQRGLKGREMTAKMNEPFADKKFKEQIEILTDLLKSRGIPEEVITDMLKGLKSKAQAVEFLENIENKIEDAKNALEDEDNEDNEDTEGANDEDNEDNEDTEGAEDIEGAEDEEGKDVAGLSL